MKILAILILSVMFIGCGTSPLGNYRTVSVQDGDTIPIDEGEEIAMPQTNITSIQAVDDGLVVNVMDGGIADVDITQIASSEATESSSGHSMCSLSEGTYEDYKGICDKALSVDSCKDKICEFLDL